LTGLCQRQKDRSRNIERERREKDCYFYRESGRRRKRRKRVRKKDRRERRERYCFIGFSTILTLWFSSIKRTKK
jgi:hypothetical protein